jgi:hypothetical protein
MSKDWGNYAKYKPRAQAGHLNLFKGKTTAMVIKDGPTRQVTY